MISSVPALIHTPALSSIALPTTSVATLAATQALLPSLSGASVPVGAVAGGIVGGVILLALIVAIVCVLSKRRKTARALDAVAAHNKSTVYGSARAKAPATTYDVGDMAKLKPTAAEFGVGEFAPQNAAAANYGDVNLALQYASPPRTEQQYDVGDL
jgi:hypothetical protein